MKEFFTFWKGIVLKLITNKDATYDRDGAMYQDTDRKVKIRLDGSERELITNTQIQDLENKSIDASNNIIINLKHGTEVDEPITGVHGVGAGDIVGTDKIQTVTNKIIDIDNNTVSNIETDNLKAGVLNTNLTGAATDNEIPSALATKTGIEDVAGDLVTHESDTSTHGVTEILGAAEVQTVTNKIIDIDNNTVSNIETDNLKVGVLDTDLTSVSASDDTIPSAKATKTYIDANDTADNTSYDNGASGLTATNVKDAIDEVDSNIESHESATTVHGITGDVVGDQDVQSLTNKDIDGLTASDTSRLTLPKNTTAGLDLLTDKEATIAFDTDKKSLVLNDGSNWNEVTGAGGQGGINFCLNPDAEVDTSGWAKFNDGAVDKPVDGTGGTSNMAFIRNTIAAQVLRGNASFLFSNSSVSAKGQGVSYDFTIDNADKASMVQVTFDYFTNTTFELGDVVAYIYDITNSKLIEFSDGEIEPTDYARTFNRSFQTSHDSVSYRLILFRPNTNLTRIIYFDNVIVGPQAPSAIGAAGWKQYDISSYISGVGFTTSYATAIPYKTLDGTWRLQFNIEGDSVSTSSLDLLISGIVGSTNFVYQNASATGLFNATGVTNAGLRTLTNKIEIRGTADTSWIVSGDVELDSKPTWAEDTSNVILSETTMNREISAQLGLSTGSHTDNGNWQQIPFNTIGIDTIGAVSGSEYVVEEKGTYKISPSVRFAAGAVYVGIRIKINGVAGERSQIADSVYFESAAINLLKQLDKDDIITIEALQGSGGTLAYSTTDTYLSIQKTNTGSQTIAQSAKVYAIYADDSGQVIPDNAPTKITWNTKRIDTDGSLVNGVFTAPKGGVLKIKASISIVDIDNLYTVYIRTYNATKSSYIYMLYENFNDTRFGLYQLSCSCDMVVNKGDKVEIQVFQDHVGVAGATMQNHTSYNNVSFTME